MSECAELLSAGWRLADASLHAAAWKTQQGGFRVRPHFKLQQEGLKQSKTYLLILCGIPFEVWKEEGPGADASKAGPPDLWHEAGTLAHACPTCTAPTYHRDCHTHMWGREMVQ